MSFRLISNPAEHKYVRSTRNVTNYDVHDTDGLRNRDPCDTHVFGCSGEKYLNNTRFNLSDSDKSVLFICVTIKEFD